MSLKGYKASIIVDNPILMDGRVLKQAYALSSAGIEVLVLGYDDENLTGDSDYIELETKHPFRIVLCKRDYIHPASVDRIEKSGVSDIWYHLNILNARINPKVIKKLFFSKLQLECLLDFKPDLIHSCDVTTLWTGVRAAEICEAKLIYDSHELFSGYFKSPIVQFVSNCIERRCIASSDGVITVSNQISECLKQRYKLPTSPTVLYNSPPFKDVSYQKTGTPVQILMQGAMRPDSREDLAITAMQYLQGRARLTIQGGASANNKTYFDSLESLVLDLGLSDSVQLTGKFDPEETVSEASNFDLGLILFDPKVKNHQYTLSNRFFVYMMAGVASLASACRPYADFPEFDRIGRIVCTKSAKSLADDIACLISQREEIESMKEYSLEMTKLYSWEIQSDKYLTLCKELLS